MLMLQLVAHVLVALGVCGTSGGGGASAAGGGGGDGGPPDMGMDAGCCSLASIVARIVERRGGLFGAAPRSMGQAPSVDLLAGHELRMQRLRLPRQA